jgi:hypothetical protein
MKYLSAEISLAPLKPAAALAPLIYLLAFCKSERITQCVQIGWALAHPIYMPREAASTRAAFLPNSPDEKGKY